MDSSLQWKGRDTAVGHLGSADSFHVKCEKSEKRLRGSSAGGIPALCNARLPACTDSAFSSHAIGEDRGKSVVTFL